MTRRFMRAACWALLVFVFAFDHAGSARAAGTLAPVSSGLLPMRILAHHVEVSIDNGFARTEVTQVFQNPNPDAVEAVYTLPLPDGAALSELTAVSGDQTLYGEVVPRDQATQVYQQQVTSGGQAGLAVKQGYQRFEFRIARVPAGEQATMTFAYYQTIEIDAGIGRYLYPLEEGGTDEEADAFWTRNDTVDSDFSAHVTVRSAFPIADVRMPDFEDVAEIVQPAEGMVEIDLSAQRNLDRDVVLYYRLADDLPGRVEVIPYRADPEGPGTFMMVLTPGVDLAPLERGADYVFVLDVSRSMESKLATLKAAVTGAIRALQPGDRFRIVKFSDTAAEITRGFVAGGAANEGDSLAEATAAVDALTIEGGTNLYAGLDLALTGLDAERASAVLLVTDGVTNEGLVDGPSFSRLLGEKDVRVHGFLMGNGANWPLMQLITETSGGFYQAVSNDDDIAGQLLLARNKLTHAALHDFEVTIEGGDTSELTHNQRKVHRGEQVVIFGRYDRPGPVTFHVEATLTGHKQRYDGSFELPARDEGNPELERLWAFAEVHWLEYQREMELTDAATATAQIAQLGVAYQLVTDETSMILLDDADFARFGIDPMNRDRAQREEQARMLRGAGAPIDHSVAVDPAFAGGAGGTSLPSSGGAPSSGSGQGAPPSGGSGYSGRDYASDGYGGGAVGGAEGLLLALLALASRGLGRVRLRRGR